MNICLVNLKLPHLPSKPTWTRYVIRKDFLYLTNKSVLYKLVVNAFVLVKLVFIYKNAWPSALLNLYAMDHCDK